MFPKIVSPSISMITEMPADWRLVRCLSRQGLILSKGELRLQCGWTCFSIAISRIVSKGQNHDHELGCGLGRTFTIRGLLLRKPASKSWLVATTLLREDFS